MLVIALIAVVLSFNAIYALIPILVIIILIAAGAGLARGFDIFNLFGFGAIIGITQGTRRGLAGAGYSGSSHAKSRSGKLYGTYGPRRSRQAVRTAVKSPILGKKSNIYKLGKAIHGLSTTGSTANMNTARSLMLLGGLPASGPSISTPLEGSLSTRLQKKQKKIDRLSNKMSRNMDKIESIEKKTSRLEKGMEEGRKVIFSSGSYYIRKRGGEYRQGGRKMSAIPVIGSTVVVPLLTAFRPNTLKDEINRLAAKKSTQQAKGMKYLYKFEKEKHEAFDLATGVTGEGAWEGAKKRTKEETRSRVDREIKELLTGKVSGPLQGRIPTWKLMWKAATVYAPAYLKLPASEKKRLATAQKNESLQLMFSNLRQKEENLREKGEKDLGGGKKLKWSTAGVEELQKKIDAERAKGIGASKKELNRMVAEMYAARKLHREKAREYRKQLSYARSVLKYSEPRLSLEDTVEGLHVAPSSRSRDAALAEYLSGAHHSNVMLNLPENKEADRARLWRSVALTYVGVKRGRKLSPYERVKDETYNELPPVAPARKKRASPFSIPEGDLEEENPE